MKKYKVFKNGEYLEGYNRRYEAEEAIQQHKHRDRMCSIQNLTCVPCNIYEIRR